MNYNNFLLEYYTILRSCKFGIDMLNHECVVRARIGKYVGHGGRGDVFGECCLINRLDV